jgi:hypothetical protein
MLNALIIGNFEYDDENILIRVCNEYVLMLYLFILE